MKVWFLALVLSAATPVLAEDDGPTAADLKTSFMQFGTSFLVARPSPSNSKWFLESLAPNI